MLLDAGLAEVQEPCLDLCCYVVVVMVLIGLTLFSSPTLFYVKLTVDLDVVAVVRLACSY